MKAVARRIARLENRLAPADEDRLLVLLSHSGWGLALDEDRCIEILKEAGHVPARGNVFVDLSVIPLELNAADLERYLREHGGEFSPKGRASATDFAAPTSPPSGK
jgi:hypothetical protein